MLKRPTLFALLLLAAGCTRDDASSVAIGPDGSAAPAARTALTGRLASPIPGRMQPSIGAGHAFASLPDRGNLVGYPAKPVVRHDGAYTWHRAELSERHAIRAITTGVMRIKAPSGEELAFRYDRHEEYPNGDWSWVGHLVNGSQVDDVVITFGAKAAFGTIAQAGGKPPLRLTIQDGVSWLIETDRSAIASIHNAATDPKRPDYRIPPKVAASMKAGATGSTGMASASAPAMAAATAAGDPVVDLVIGYTPGFASGLGGDSQAQTRLNNMVAITNEAYANSQVPGRVRLVKTLLVNYPDATLNDTALEEMTGFKSPSTRTTPAAAFSALRAARDQYGADLVSLVRKFNDPENDGCGIAWLVGGSSTGRGSIDRSDEFFGYSVISDGRDTGTDGKTYFCREETLAHELGHNMGSQHDRATATENGKVSYGVFPYSFGYKSAAGAGNFYTVMAYGDRGQTAYRTFSNPRTTLCGGFACGMDGEADVARSLTQTMPLVAEWRAKVVQDAPRAEVPSDIDGDGRSDLLFQNAGQGLLAYWAMNGASPLRYSDVYAQPAGYVRVAQGDFNGDGRLDIVWARPADRNLLMWQGTGTGFTAVAIRDYSSGWEVVGAGDIDGDGRSDLLFQNAGQGLLAYWAMNGASPLRYSDVYAQPAGYVRVAQGDFNGDGRLDIVWARPADRNLLMWQGTGTGFTAVAIRDYSSGWEVVGAGDIDGDGRSDLLFQNAGQGLLAYWAMNGASPLRYSDVYAQPAGYVRVAQGDFNGDGRLDIVWARPADRNLLMWQGTGTGFTLAVVRDYSAGWEVVQPVAVRRQPEVPSDIDGDGRSDLLFQNAGQGLLAYWAMNGASPLRYSDVYAQPAGYVRVAQGDFNGDGRLDIVWARPADRNLLMWQGTGTGFTAVAIRDYSSGWEVVGAGDIDGDGRSDLLFQNAGQGLLAYWAMNGASPLRYSDVYAQPAGYVRVAQGDFNGDGRLDIVWARPADRNLLMWQGTGTGFTAVAIRDYSNGWEVVGAGDIDGDGRSDLLFQNAGQGLLAYWAMNGASPLRYSDVYAQPAGYVRVAQGDFNGDGRLDIVWARPADRNLLMWQGTGTGFTLAVVRDYSAGWAPVGGN